MRNAPCRHSSPPVANTRCHGRFLTRLGRLACLSVGLIVSVPAAAQSLSFEPRALDFGTVVLGGEKPPRGSIRITNRSSKPIRLAEVDMGRTRLRVAETFDTLRPGETKPLTLEMTPEDNPWPASGTLVKLRFGEGPEVVEESFRVRWRVVHPVTSDPPAIMFKEMKLGERRAAMVSLRISQPLEGEELTIKDARGTFPFVTAKVVDGTKLQVDVRFPEDFDFRSPVGLLVDLGSNRRDLPQLRIPINRTGVGKSVRANLNSIAMAKRPPLDGSVFSIRITDFDKNPLSIDRIELDGKDILTPVEKPEHGMATILPLNESSRWNALIDVTILPTTPGTRQQLVIRFKDSSFDQIEIPVHHAYD